MYANAFVILFDTFHFVRRRICVLIRRVYMYHRYKWRDFGASRDRKVKIVYKIIDTWSFRQRQIEHCQRTHAHTPSHTFVNAHSCCAATNAILSNKKDVNTKNVERRIFKSNVLFFSSSFWCSVGTNGCLNKNKM